MDTTTKRFVKAAEEQGWRVEERKKGYLAFWPPDKSLSCVIRAKTPSDYRADRNFLSEMSKRGFIWPHMKAKERQAKKEAG